MLVPGLHQDIYDFPSVSSFVTHLVEQEFENAEQ